MGCPQQVSPEVSPQPPQPLGSPSPHQRAPLHPEPPPGALPVPVAVGFWLLPSHAPYGTRGPSLGLGIPAPGPGLGMEPWPNKWPQGWGGLCPQGAGGHGVRWSPSGSPGVFPAASKQACVPPRPPWAAGSVRFYWCRSSNKRCQLSPQTSSARFPPAHNPKSSCSVPEGVDKIPKILL